MKTLRKALEALGEPGADGHYPKWPGDFHCTPPKLSDAIRMLAHSKVSSWTRPNEWPFGNEDWTEECQGVTTGHWYLCSNKCGWLLEPERRAIYKFDISMNLLDVYELRSLLETFFGNVVCNGVHVGGIDWHDGVIHIAVEQPRGLILLSDDFTFATPTDIFSDDGGPPPQGDKFPWCAVNPVNGLLYSSTFDKVDRVFAYDPQMGYRHAATLELPITTQKVQGGCFSPEGKLYLSSSSSNDIRGFSALTGAYLGSVAIEVDEDLDQEVEGICYWHMTANGDDTQVHVILLENEDSSSDDMWLKHYASPVPEAV